MTKKDRKDYRFSPPSWEGTSSERNRWANVAASARFRTCSLAKMFPTWVASPRWCSIFRGGVPRTCHRRRTNGCERMATYLVVVAVWRGLFGIHAGRRSAFFALTRRRDWVRHPERPRGKCWSGPGFGPSHSAFTRGCPAFVPQPTASRHRVDCSSQCHRPSPEASRFTGTSGYRPNPTDRQRNST